MKTVLTTSFDSNYVEQSLVALHSFLSNTKEINFDIICIVSEDILDDAEHYSKLLGHKVSFVTAHQTKDLVSRGLAIADHGVPVHCYQRIFLGSLFEDYAKCIYIDPDTITIRDTTPILKYPMRSPFMAVMEDFQQSKIIFNDEDRPYFNNGVMIIDLNFWRSFDTENKLIKWIEEFGPTMTQEQDAMNAVLLDWWSPLPTNFNTLEFMLYLDPYFAQNHENPMIVHYLGEIKPWSKDARIYKWTQIWIDYYKKMFS